MNEKPEGMEETKDVQDGSQQAVPETQTSETDESGKNGDLAQKLAEAEKQVEYYKDLLLRKVAEFDNIKKRAEGEAASVVRYAKVDVIQSLLPIIDDFERSLKLSKDRRESEAFSKGVELIYQKLMKFLDIHGVKQIESLGKEFDVQFHDALLQVPRHDVPPHVVIEVVEKGYTLDDRVLRHAKVVVSATPAGNTADRGATEHKPSGSTTGTSMKPEN
jgi:molecular chaperone GrpE